jgi:hypothetical protein
MSIVMESYCHKPLNKEQRDLLGEWFATFVAGNRFDQKEPCAEYPAPTGPGAPKAVLVVCRMELHIINDPSVAEQFEPLADGTYPRPKTAGPWHEFEQACLIEEVAELQRSGGFESKVYGTNMFRYLSNRLNVLYGIDRSENSVKNTWYRELRAHSGIDERAGFRSPGKNTARLSSSMRVSLTSPRRGAGRGGSTLAGSPIGRGRGRHAVGSQPDSPTTPSPAGGRRGKAIVSARSTPSRLTRALRAAAIEAAIADAAVDEAPSADEETTSPPKKCILKISSSRITRVE